MDPREEIARYKSGGARFVDLSPDAQEVLKEEWREQRCGFKPDLIFRASGVTMGVGRQAVLSQAHKYVTPTRTPPVKVYRDVQNKYDEYAIAIELPRVYNDVAGVWEAWEQVGFVPRGLCPGCGRTLTGPQLSKSDHCPTCKTELFVGEGENRIPTHYFVELNKFICGLIDKDAIEFACDTIAVKEEPGRSNNIGLSIAAKIKTENLDTYNAPDRQPTQDDDGHGETAASQQAG